MKELIKQIQSLPGFKISSSHFRLGSKVHISPFYYAKRLFQNSFYTSKLAFLLTKDIIVTHKDKISFFKEEGLTLIGYGLYSELLLSFVEKYLKQYLNFEKINHDILNDLEESTFTNQDETKYNNIIIIVPIASTFSTAIKIEHLIKKYFPSNPEPLLPHYNLLHINHSPAGHDEKDNDLQEIEKIYGWKKKETENKKVYVEMLSPYRIDELSANKEYEQKYFLSLPSIWHTIEKCKICFPDQPDTEMPLFYTDKTSVTPSLVLGKPQGKRTLDILRSNYILSPEHLIYGHYERGSNHYHYYIKIEKFFNDNKPRIKNWLGQIKRNSEFKNIFDKANRVMIIAPGHYSNAGFIHLANEILFANSATIIHYDPSNDHVQNFQLFYGNDINISGTKIIFIDDTITTGNTFTITHNFLEHTIKSHSGFDALITILDRSSEFVYKNILRKLKSYDQKSLFFSFSELQVPSLRDIDGICPLCDEKKRYTELISNTFLDCIKYHFVAQSRKIDLIGQNSSYKNEETFRSSPTDRYITRVEAIHRIHQWFAHETRNKYWSVLTFNDWKNLLLVNTKTSFKNTLLYSNKSKSLTLSEVDISILKVLTQLPFTHYKPIRENVFKWILELLIQHSRKIETSISQNSLDYKIFSDFKFLLRRAGLLNANYLISIEAFKLLKLLYNENGIINLKQKLNEKLENRKKELKFKPKVHLSACNGIEDYELLPQVSEKIDSSNVLSTIELENRIKNLSNFNIFYAAQIKELLFFNEARSIKIEENLKQLNLAESSILFRQLIRIIQEENGILIQKFWEFLKNDSIYSEKFSTDDPSDKIESLISLCTLQEFTKEYYSSKLKKLEIQVHFRYKVLEQFFTTIDQEKPDNNILFHYYLMLMHFFEKEKEGKLPDLHLNDKIEFIMDTLRRMCFKEDNNSGAFFLVRYKEGKNPFVAYNKANNVIVRDYDLTGDKIVTLFDYMGGKNSSKIEEILSITELFMNNSNWEDLYSNQVQKSITLTNSFLPDKCNHLVLIRLKHINKNWDSHSVKNKNEIDGLIGFYYWDDNKTLLNINITRYLLLIRATLVNFMERHIKNDEFRDWIEAEKSKWLVQLAGHGKDVLMKIAREKNEKYNTIVLNLQHIQLICAFKSTTETITGKQDIIDRFNNFYKIGIHDPVDFKFIQEIKQMADEIFEFKEIERRVPVTTNIVQNIDPQLSFSFSKQIIDLMCFEILYNAKKNRWEFLQEEIIHTQKGDFKENYIWISANIKEKENLRLLEIRITNTGPLIDERILGALNNGKNPKPDNRIAGLFLLKTLLSKNEFNLGEIKYKSELLNLENSFSVFTVVLELNEMRN